MANIVSRQRLERRRLRLSRKKFALKLNASPEYRFFWRQEARKQIAAAKTKQRFERQSDPNARYKPRGLYRSENGIGDVAWWTKLGANAHRNMKHHQANWAEYPMMKTAVRSPRDSRYLYELARTQRKLHSYKKKTKVR